MASPAVGTPALTVEEPREEEMVVEGAGEGEGEGEEEGGEGEMVVEVDEEAAANM